MVKCVSTSMVALLSGVSVLGFRNGGCAPFAMQRTPVRSAVYSQSKDMEPEDPDEPGSPPPLFDMDLVDALNVGFQMDDSNEPQPVNKPEQQPEQQPDGMELLYGTESEYKVDGSMEALYGNDDNTLEATDYWGADASTTDEEFIRDDDLILTEREDRFFTSSNGQTLLREKCLLVGVEDLSLRRSTERNLQQTLNPEEWNLYFTLEESLAEMRELIDTAGLQIVEELTQRLQEPNPKTYIGSGKLAEVLELAIQTKVSTVVFDAELAPAQQKGLENAFNKQVVQNLQNDFRGAVDLEIKVIDRTALILDIFAQHAKTREGKLQVDLALHEYRKPRLTKMWTHLERQSGAGGVGLRGPGESQLEIDKRLLRDRIIVLKRKIDEVQKQRNLHRKGRENLGLPILALVGYTNSGKSTLLNFLTRAGILAENILFATLDPTTRKVKLPGYKTHPEVLLTDTVGFIQKLPTQLVAAFRATLEEVREADVLVHVVDSSNPMWAKQEAAVIKVLQEIGCGDKPIVRVLNKIDLLGHESSEQLKVEVAKTGLSVAVSSLTGDGMQDFVHFVEEALVKMLVPIELEIPYDKGDELNMIHEVGNVELVDYRATGTYVLARVPTAIANRLSKYSVTELLDEYDNNAISNSDTAAVSSTGEEDINWERIARGRHEA
eukprot:CAMPEP_0194357344 /NCGR_PEP_ID=MMETSP0174-20130528/4839_1 /TAXON_ID=216777 /ORGANISM="Proboscia alata, Strain PI-D3" /LENGTH=664 /DNA_ID=CAMNT_0039127323 /DNA_START=92 /DNA_END=2086 /DNA_ORIENTATION=+